MGHELEVGYNFSKMSALDYEARFEQKPTAPLYPSISKKLFCPTKFSGLHQAFDEFNPRINWQPIDFKQLMIPMAVGLGAIAAFMVLARLARRTKSSVIQPVKTDTIRPTLPVVSSKIPNKVIAYELEMSNVSLNGKGNSIVIKPGEELKVDFEYRQLASRYEPRILIGYDKGGLQGSIQMDQSRFRGPAAINIKDRASIAFRTKGSLMRAGEVKSGSIMIKAPTKPGTYQIRFRYSEWGPHGWGINGIPPKEATIGSITVR